MRIHCAVQVYCSDNKNNVYYIMYSVVNCMHENGNIILQLIIFAELVYPKKIYI